MVVLHFSPFEVNFKSKIYFVTLFIIIICLFVTPNCKKSCFGQEIFFLKVIKQYKIYKHNIRIIK